MPQHLGNVVFDNDGNDNVIVDEAAHRSLTAVAQLLHITNEALHAALCKRSIITPDETVVLHNTADQAMGYRDALCKALYESVFDWLVRFINHALEMGHASDGLKRIGVLDIFGFEKFETNRFEQFCINYANEKLQNQFNKYVFEHEQLLYEAEDIRWDRVDFNNNQKCIELIELRAGIIDALSDECNFPKGNDEGFATRVRREHNDKNPYFVKPLKQTVGFGIKHYAGEVIYTAHGFCESNKDTLHPSLIDLVRSSSAEHIAALAEIRLAPVRSATPTKRRASVSVYSDGLAAQFKNSLNKLVGNIGNTEPHYIRCVNPNSLKQPGSFDHKMVLEQLHSGGVMEAVKVTRAGYPTRWAHADFIARCGHTPAPMARATHLRTIPSA